MSVNVCRYLGSPDAAWTTFQLPMQLSAPHVKRLPTHLEDEQSVRFDENDDQTELGNLLERADNSHSMLQGWFKYNAEHEGAHRQLLFCEFPKDFVWEGRNKKWRPRSARACSGKDSIGRMYQALPSRIGSHTWPFCCP